MCVCVYMGRNLFYFILYYFKMPTTTTKDPVKRKLKHYQYEARKNNYEWSLTFDEFQNLITQPCKYCGDSSGGENCYRGIDRINNSLGYTLQNCVPCCKLCNLMKYVYPVDQFLTQCKAIANCQTLSTISEKT